MASYLCNRNPNSKFPRGGSEREPVRCGRGVPEYRLRRAGLDNKVLRGLLYGF